MQSEIEQGARPDGSSSPAAVKSTGAFRATLSKHIESMSKAVPTRNRRPQPAGWDKAMKRVLKPEHVERLSDTQVRITLLPCPDFDIEEDEEVEIWIPPQMLVKATRPVFAGTFTIKAASFEERIDNAIQGLSEERAELGPSSVLAAFLLSFFTCEIVAKAVVSHSRCHRTRRKALADKWSTKDIARALAVLDIQFDQPSLDALFSTEKALASDMSARALRDSVTHRMKRVHRQAVRDRYSVLMETMEGFLHAVSEWRERRRLHAIADSQRVTAPKQSRGTA